LDKVLWTAVLLPSLTQLAQALGGEVTGRQVLCPGPGHSPRDRSLCIRFTAGAPDGFIVHSFSGDDPLACKDYVRNKLGLPPWQPGDEQDRRIHPSKVRDWDRATVDVQAEDRERTEDDLLRIKRAIRIWDEARDPRGTLAETYLRSRRLILADELASTVLRFHPRCPWRNENTSRTDRVPALIAAFRSIDDDSITAIHRIALNADGTKIGRRMLGVVQRAAVKLDPDINNEIAVGEGVETCMAARQLGYQPAWALGSVGMISFFPVLDGVQRLRLLAETGEASAAAIRLCGTRWYRAGRRVQIIRPSIGSDLNDELMGRA
jgi:putative DNA primase/helicase